MVRNYLQIALAYRSFIGLLNVVKFLMRVSFKMFHIRVYCQRQSFLNDFFENLQRPKCDPQGLTWPPRGEVRTWG
jgi:hypothetical protein